MRGSYLYDRRDALLRQFGNAEFAENVTIAEAKAAQRLWRLSGMTIFPFDDETLITMFEEFVNEELNHRQSRSRNSLEEILAAERGLTSEGKEGTGECGPIEEV